MKCLMPTGVPQSAVPLPTAEHCPALCRSAEAARTVTTLTLPAEEGGGTVLERFNRDINSIYLTSELMN